MKYAIIELKGHQYQVGEGEELIVDRLDKKEGNKIEIETILLIRDGEKTLIGTPILKKANVTARILKHFKGRKIRVAKYKAKSRYRRVKGFRPYLTRIKIEKINTGEKNVKN